MVSAIRPHYVYDNANVVDSGIEATINFYGQQIDSATTAEVVIVTLQTLPEGKSVEETKLYYMNDVALDGVKGIGKVGKDNGVLILLVMDTKDWAIETGYGVEGQLPDAECGRIGRDIMVPQFQQGKFGDGLYYGMKEVGRKLGFDATVVVSETTSETTTLTELPQWVWICGAILLVIVVISLISWADDGDGSSYSGRSHSSGHSGGGGATGKW